MDPRAGLPKLRKPWVERREAKGVHASAGVTQMALARAGIISEEMAYVAAREGMDPEYVRSEVRAGSERNSSRRGSQAVPVDYWWWCAVGHGEHKGVPVLGRAHAGG